MKDTWLRPLWRILGDSAFVAARPYPRAQADAILTYEKVIAIIERDVGSSELVFRAALRVPLPPAIPYELELIQKPTYQSLIHSVAPADFKRAVVDIAKTIIELRDVDLCFPAITPDRMLFQHQQLSAGRPCGFILDLDPLAMSSSLTDCAGQHHDPRALRLAAYDLAAAPHLPSSSGLAPRHALEALFNVLVWFCTYTRFDDEGRLTPVRGAPYSGIWLNPTGSALVSNRASHEYATFLQSRRAFMWAPGGGRKDVLLDGCGGKTEKAPMPDSMEALREDWVKPLWRMVSEAHFFARWREGEDGFDWATLGGQFTVERFMAVLSPEAT
ncbi:hypothetical protein B0H15DRAFT_796168 [Mycena belliarum]|uniref:Uncharacterized protein n=1 Tax=Mycena belliarum TaxID=1033014 RepID=A0AAD6XYB5_9AGAR|nr:hypothetical protein B0H15DRAFT_796168 [Mycena belliae]